MAIQSLIKLKTIKVLSLEMSEPFFQENLILLAKKLIELTDIRISTNVLNETTKITMDGLIQLIQTGKKLKTIYLDRTGDLHLNENTMRSLQNAVISGEQNRDVTIIMEHSNMY